MSYTDDEECATAEEFIEYFQQHRWLRTRHQFETFRPGAGGFIFRGQSDAEWKLVPSAFRENALVGFSPQVAGTIPSDRKLLNLHLGFQLHAELRAVYIFLETADRLGIPTPIDYSNVEHNELLNALLNNKESANYNPSFPSVRVLNQLALAQHHGVPTRLLDWTESPFIAAFFAAYGVSSFVEEASRVESKRFAVMMLRTHDIGRYPDTLAVVISPRYGNDFMRVQKGIFTHMPNANRYFLDNLRWPSLEDIAEQNREIGANLIRVSLPTTEASELLRRLYDMDITRHSLMPSLDNAAHACSYAMKLFTPVEKKISA